VSSSSPAGLGLRSLALMFTSAPRRAALNTTRFANSAFFLKLAAIQMLICSSASALSPEVGLTSMPEKSAVHFVNVSVVWPTSALFAALKRS